MDIFEDFSVTQELRYLFIFCLVLIFPKMLLRFKVPSGITALTIGIACAFFDPTLPSDQLIRFLSLIGITSLFVFAGFEVDFKELKEDAPYLGKYLLKSIAVLFCMAFGFSGFFDLPFQDSLIFALGIFTPSAGFILNSLHSYKIGGDLEYWVKSKAISKELIAVFLLFLAMQGGDLKSLVISIAFFSLLIFILPSVFKFFFKFISPFAPNSEVPFLVVLSLAAGVLSKEVGAYYLVGAFVVGLSASRFKKEFIKGEEEENLFSSLSSFFNVFLPFYFFSAGLRIDTGSFSWQTLAIAISLVAIFVPLRFFLIRTSIQLFLKDFRKKAFDISLSLMPTLIFGLVIAGVLQERARLDESYVLALVLYTVLASIIPTIIFSFINRRTKKLEATS